ncbi:hypothetical protein KJ854_03105 [Patescibacteria group bacterium]|nr:hypothetical protein [Patescibacteria group bacterium]
MKSNLELENYLNQTEKEKQNIFDIISKEKINEYKKEIEDNNKIDLSDININILHPGDNLYDHYEIQQKLFLKCNSDFSKMINLIKEYNYDPNDVTIDEFRDIAKKEGIVLEGKFPSFAMTDGDSDINFMGIKEENVIEMAKKYALKENEQQSDFSNIEEAENYLESLGEKYFLHEVGHTVYKKLKIFLQEKWKKFIENNFDLKKKVTKVQEDKYNDEEQIPIDQESFADYFIDVSSNGKLISRLGENNEAVEKIKSLLNKNKI